ncbi:beta strand repeat-containing protein [Burkholderia pyrrocinia]|uniref:beta strand repeat-containing protein n=1 Tax=Burkholderia pyrrocinia TaxID=60550 RepID=UPI0039EF1346
MNVEAGTEATDAANVGQVTSVSNAVGDLRASLEKSGAIVDDGAGNLTSLAVGYDDATKRAVTLGGVGATDAVQLKNVANATDGTDAVNLDQMNSAIASSGANNAYISGRGTGAAASSTALGAVALGLGSVANEINTISVGNSATGLSRRITNVADGQNDHDAATIGQVNNLVGGATSTMNSTLGSRIGVLEQQLANSSNSEVTDIGVMGALDGGTATGSNSVAVGPGANAVGFSTAIGDHATATASQSTAVGQNAYATGGGAVALGQNSRALGGSAVALGAYSRADVTDTVAVGDYATASADYSVALGRSAQATESSAVAIGYNSVADRANSVSVGSSSQQRQITNVKAGTEDTDAANVGQVTSVSTAVGDLRASLEKSGAIVDDGAGNLTSLAVGYDDATKRAVTLGGIDATDAVQLKNVANATDTTDAVNLGQMNAAIATSVVNNPYVKVDGERDGSDDASVAAGTYAMAIGADANATGMTAVALGAGAASTGTASVAMGAGANAAANNALALGGNSAVTGANAVGVGAGTVASGNSAVAVGFNARAQASNAFALGTTASASASDSLALGTLANVDAAATSAVAIGRRAGVTSTGTNAVALGAGSIADRPDTVSVGSAAQQRQITNVAAGTADTDAVNFSQLKTYVADNGGADNPLAVAYDDATKRALTLGGVGATDAVTLKNVAQGVAGTDAVNVDQLTTATKSIRDDLAAGTLDMRYIKVNATGAQANAAGTNAVAIGSSANANGIGALALGTGSRAAGLNAVAIGANSVANRANTVSVGSAGNERKIVNVAEGDVTADSTDAINGSQLYSALDKLSTTFDQKTQQLASFSMGVMDVEDPLVAIEGLRGPNTASLNGGDPLTSTAVAIGSSSAAAGADTVAIGLQTVAGSNNSVALGSFAQTGAGQDYAVAIGSDAQTNGTQAVAIGAHVQANADNAVAVGNNDTWALGASSVALGDHARVGARSDNSIAVGHNAAVAANVTSALALGSGATVAAGANNGVALGAGSVANRGNALSIGGGTVGQRQIVNVAAGTQSTDAVNVSQLAGVTQALGGGASVGADGGIVQPKYTVNGKDYANVADAIGAAASSGGTSDDVVAYDDDTKAKVTLAGTTGTTISNVAAGAVSATSMDAINGSQLFGTAQSVADALGGGATVGTDGTITQPTYTVGGTNVRTVGAALTNLDGRTTANTGDIADLKDQLAGSGLVDPTTGDPIAAVTYDRNADGTPNYGSVTLGGAGATAAVALKNVADGVDDHDAVNVAQLKSAGLVGEGDDGKLTSLAVGYDDATKGSITLQGGTDGTTISNVAAGAVSATSMDAINGSQLFGTAQSVADALGGGATVGTDGTITQPTYTVGGTDVRTVGAALTNLDGRTTANTGAIADLKDQFAGSGLVDPTTGAAIAAVTYDRLADGTPNYGSVTLGGAGATAAVTLKNVATGVDGTDAVNVSQLSSGLSDLRDDLTNGAIDLRFIKVNADPSAGVAAIASGAQAVAIGTGAAGTGAHALALGTGARASGIDSVALGYNSVANQANTVSVGRVGGERRIVNVADGDVALESTDAINGGQLFAAMNSLTTSVDTKTQQALDSFSSSLDAKTQAAIDKMDSTRSAQLMDVTDPLIAVEGLRGDNLASLNGADAATKSAVAVGVSSVAAGGDAIAVGLQTVAGSDNSVAIGSFAQTGAGQDYAVAIGSDAQTNGTQAVALGAHVQANADRALAVGSNDTWALGASSIALGDGAKSRAGTTNSIAMGTGSNVSTNVTNAIALGANANVAAGANGGIALGAGSLANRGNALSIGSVGAERQIVNVAAGTQSTDAVNVGQLAGVTQALGGGASVGADGSIVQPKYTINGKEYASVADALDAAAASGGGTPVEGVVAYDDATKSSLTLAGATGTTISNVAAGAVSATSMDAINGSQLFGTAQSVADTLGGGAAVGADGTITQPAYTVGGTNVRTVGEALTNIDGRTTANTGAIADLKDQFAGSGLVDPATGASLAAVTYDLNADGTTNRGSVTMGGAGAAGPVTLKNVAAGVDDHDAVNVAQLKSAGLVGEGDDGKLTSLAVAYDDAGKTSITLGGAGTPVSIHNVAAGAVSATSTDAINGSQLFGTAQSVADAIGGGTTVDADGNLANTAIEVNGYKYKSVSEAVQAAAAYGATDSLAVRYDLNRDGTANYGSITLGGSAAAPVVLTNVANGTSQYDAVNYGQLSDLQAEFNDRFGSMDDRVGKLELGDGSGSGSGGGDLIGGSGGSGGAIVPPKPGNGSDNVAIGSGSTIADGANNGTAIGSGSNVGGTGGTAIGSGSNAGGEGSSAVGQDSKAGGKDSVAIGRGSSASDEGSVAVGQGSSVAAGAGNSVAIGQGSVATESNTVSFGSAGNERRLTNIADGINASDAATKGQLDRAVGGLQGQINDVSKNAYSGIAAATALTMIPGVDPGKTLSFGIGGATYKGYQAVAFGGEARITQNLKMKAGVGLSSGGNTVGVGASYQW